MSRTVIALMAIGAVVIAAALGIAWRVKMNDRAAVAAATPAAPVTPPPVATPAPASTPAPPAEAKPAETATPSFDVARIGADGRAVIAGRATPGAKIVILDGGKEI